MPDESLPLHARRGVTLIELLVALVLLTIGGAALAAGSRTAVRAYAAAHATALAATVLERRLDSLRVRCPVVSGSARHGAVGERWTVAGAAGAAVEVDLEATIHLADRQAVRRVRAAVRCTP